MDTKDQIKKLLEDAWKLRGLGNYVDSKTILSQAERMCQPNDYSLLGRVFHIYMQYDLDKDNFKDALKHNSQSISFYDKAENYDLIAHAIRHRADIHFALNQIEESESDYKEAIAIYKGKSDTLKGDLANALRGYALVLEKRKVFNNAISVWQEVLSLYEDVAFSDGVIEAKGNIDRLESELKL